MIVCEDEEYMQSVISFAEDLGLKEDFEAKLDYLATYSDKETKCIMWKDFAPQSFTFTMYSKNYESEWKQWFHGGLIFHGHHDNGGDGSAPTFAVNVGDVRVSGCWSIHT